ncbi:hypothetical protein ARMSODRAFT_972120 [Armillaria solidipes]|uniref:Uncharacterized protein n=1 Tax=Armillaria solidipes TaxID=1076256 RepID=A0A2H3BVU2_9AGAR|nr:hypothetical protein ARMSODRAFT_972120 [Armillaria solidipes]
MRIWEVCVECGWKDEYKRRSLEAVGRGHLVEIIVRDYDMASPSSNFLGAVEALFSIYWYVEGLVTEWINEVLKTFSMNIMPLGISLTMLGDMCSQLNVGLIMEDLVFVKGNSTAE